jgi:tetratricopeptide (TPR) repeat protein
MVERNQYPWRASEKHAEPVLATEDPRSMESAIDLIADGAERYASRASQRAQDLIWEAWETTGGRRAALVRQALALWPDCADAYVLRAQETALSLEQKRELLERGVAAGERALGRRVFQEDVGDFWLIFETRPYMRARAALAAVLWRLGWREDAVEHQRELLRLNPRDNQGLRYRQANWLLALGCHVELDQLFAAHADEGSALGFAYTRALAAFARRGDDVESRGVLIRARELNPHIPAYLTGRKKLPRKRPAYTVFGEDSEAVDYAAGAGELWAGVPGALAWLKDERTKRGSDHKSAKSNAKR